MFPSLSSQRGSAHFPWGGKAGFTHLGFLPGWSLYLLTTGTRGGEVWHRAVLRRDLSQESQPTWLIQLQDVSKGGLWCATLALSS